MIRRTGKGAWHGTKLFLGSLTFLLLLALSSLASGHPANIPVARAKVQPDGSIDLKVRMDVLAFILNQTPTNAPNDDMQALLEDPQGDLQKQLDAAQTRFKKGLFVFGDGRPAEIDSIVWPTAADVHQYALDNPYAQIPVMMTLSIQCRLPAGSKMVSFEFPPIMDSVVLTTEFPYFEPISESIDPGKTSDPHEVPTQAQIDAAAAAIKADTEARAAGIKPDPVTKSEAVAKKQIQTRYNAWSRAYMANDVITMLSILTPDYTLKASNGNLITHSEYEVMLNLRKQKGQDTTRYSTEILRLTLHADVAAVLSRETMVMHQTDPKTGKAQDVQYQHDYADVWTYVDGQWLLKSTETKKEQAQIKAIKK